ncbi:MAG: dihydropteroate synthase [Thermoplasmata archaeon]
MNKEEKTGGTKELSNTSKNTSATGGAYEVPLLVVEADMVFFSSYCARAKVHEKGKEIMERKLKHYIVIIPEVDSVQANIIKQEALARGADCAIPQAFSLCRPEETATVLLFGSFSSLKNTADKLKQQPLGLKEKGMAILKALENTCQYGQQAGTPKEKTTETDLGEKSSQAIRLFNRRRGYFEIKKPAVMGIINCTPDSFSNDGILAQISSGSAADLQGSPPAHSYVQHALTKAKKMIDDGAQILDVGGESSRPGSATVPQDEEILRVVPVIKAIRTISDIPISIDTWKPAVAEAALDAGADIINDIKALGEPGMCQVALEHRCPVVLMHMRGTPQNMQDPSNLNYTDILLEVMSFLYARARYAEKAGILHENIILDPGIGFAKKKEQNPILIKGIGAIHSLGYYSLIGLSRKSFIAYYTDAPVTERLPGSLAGAVMAYTYGADIIRVHDVRETVQALAIAQAITQAGFE